MPLPTLEVEMLPRAPRAALLALSLAVLGAPAARAAEALTMETLAPGVYAFQPTSQAFEAWRALSNSGAVVLDDGLLLYDSHLSPALVEEALAKLRAVTDKPLRYVVHSHFHGDHVGGAWAYRREVEIISHAWTRERLLRYYAELPEVLPKRIADQEKVLATEQDPGRRARAASYVELDRALLARVTAKEPVPNSSLTFDSKVMLHRGREVQVFFLGRGHTGGDAVLYLPTRFGLGFMLPPALGPSAAPTTFGHPGAGGSLALGDPERGLGFAYVMNRMSLATAGDPRADGLVAALGRCPGA